MRLERHQPVERREGLRERERDQAAPRCSAAAARRRPGRAALVLPPREPARPERDRRPHREVERGAREEEGHVQVGLLPGAGARRARPRPAGSRGRATAARAAPERRAARTAAAWPRRSPRRGAPRSPSARHRGVDQHEEQAAERDRQEEEERDQPGEQAAARARAPRRPASSAAPATASPTPIAGSRDQGCPCGIRDARRRCDAVSCVTLAPPLTTSATRAAPRRPGAAARASPSRRSVGSHDSIEMKKRSSLARSNRAEAKSGWWCSGSWLSAEHAEHRAERPAEHRQLEGDRDVRGPGEVGLAADHRAGRRPCGPRSAARSRPRRRASASTSTIQGSFERVQPHRAVEAVHRERRVRVPARVAGVAHRSQAR